MTARETTRINDLLAVRPITEVIAAEVLATPGYEHLEIVNGEWVGLDKNKEEMTTGEEHGWIEALLIVLIGGYVVKHKLGRVYPGDVTFVLDGQPGDIRRMCEPDVAFVSLENVTPTQGFIFRAPDLAIEIISPSQTYSAMTDKIDDYFRSGTRQVWLVLPDKKQVEVHFPDKKPEKYRIGQSIPGGDLLPGFTLEVAQVFEA